MESPRRRSPRRLQQRCITRSRSPPPTTATRFTSSIQSPTKPANLKPDQVPTTQDTEKQWSEADLSALPKIQVNITPLEALLTSTKSRDTNTKPHPNPKDRPIFVPRKGLPKALPISILTSHLRTALPISILPPPRLPPTFTAIDKEPQMAKTEIITISDDDEEVDLPNPHPVYVEAPKSLEEVFDSAPTGETKPIDPGNYDDGTMPMPQETLAGPNSPEAAEQSLQEGGLPGLNTVKKSVPATNSEEIVVSVSAESILAMDQEEVAGTAMPVSAVHLNRHNNNVALITSAAAAGKEISSVDHTRVSPLKRIQKPSGSGVAASTNPRAHTHTCYICLKTLTTHHEFNVHLLGHRENKCMDCGKVMETYKQLKGHVIRKIQKGSFRGLACTDIGQQNHKMPTQQPKPKYPQAQTIAMTLAVPPSGRAQFSSGNGQPQPSTSWGGGEYMMDTSPPPQDQRTMTMSKDDFDKFFPPHFMDSLLDMEKLKDNFDITPLPASQFDPSGLILATPSWTQQFPCTSGTSGAGQNACHVNFGAPPLSIVTTLASPPPRLAPAYVPAPIRPAQPPHFNYQHRSPPNPSGYQLKTYLNQQNPMASSSSSAPLQAQVQPSASTASSYSAPAPTTTPGVRILPPTSPEPVSTAPDFKSYKDLLQPLAQIKKFAMGEVDEAILFTVHELERHVMTTIMKSSSKESPPPPN